MTIEVTELSLARALGIVYLTILLFCVTLPMWNKRVNRWIFGRRVRAFL